MGEFLYRGDFSVGGLEDVFTFSIAAIAEGRSRYGFLLNENGGIIDDLIAFRLGKDEAMIVVNAATAANDFAVIRDRLNNTGEFTDISASTGKIDIQGPLSRDVLSDLIGPKAASIPYFRFLQMDILGSRAIVSRTGYTGELGYEIFLPTEKTPEVWDKILADPRVKPAGLGARDILRLEIGYSLYGNDINETVTPLEAGLSAFVDFNKEFVGKNALLRQKEKGISRGKTAFRVDSRRSPRHGHEIWKDDKNIGVVTSGCFSPMLGAGIGLGLAETVGCEPGAKLVIRHGNVSMEATVCDLPFYKNGSVRT
jgi:aminomethyltransferase